MKGGRLILVMVVILGGLYGVWRVRQPHGEGAATPDRAAAPGDVVATSDAPTDPGLAGKTGDSEPAVKEVSQPAPRPLSPAPLPAPNPPSPRRQSPAAPPLAASQRPAAVVPEPAQEAVEALALNVREYRSRFGGNPVGNNAEIVREMDGGNSKGASFLPAPLKRLNGEGELIDEWGTPFFFHQESAEQMEVRSAGADRVMWTSDDVTAR